MAAASRTDLGWDPTVQRVKVGREIHYRYTVEGKKYITHDSPLCDFRADLLIGRATRVLKVYPEGTNPLLNPDVCLALKDMWILEGAEQEGDSQGP